MGKKFFVKKKELDNNNELQNIDFNLDDLEKEIPKKFIGFYIKKDEIKYTISNNCFVAYGELHESIEKPLPIFKG
jgi:hypothetical protein